MRKEFEEAQKKEEEEQEGKDRGEEKEEAEEKDRDSNGGRKGKQSSPASFEEVAARIRAAVIELNRDKKKAAEEEDGEEGNGGRKRQEEGKERGEEQGEGERKARGKRGALPSRDRLREAIPSSTTRLPQPADVHLPELPNETNPMHVLQHVKVLGDCLKSLGVNEDLETMAVLGAVLGQFKKIDQIINK